MNTKERLKTINVIERKCRQIIRKTNFDNTPEGRKKNRICNEVLSKCEGMKLREAARMDGMKFCKAVATGRIHVKTGGRINSIDGKATPHRKAALIAKINNIKTTNRKDYRK